MRKQQLFNTVAKHLLTQNKKAIKDGICRYRFRNLSCAVGCLIPENEYSRKLEGKSMTSFVGGFVDADVAAAVKKSKTLTNLIRYHVDLVERLQRIHDSSTPMYWKEDLQKLADDFGLSAKVLEKF